jgi:hypothetical protein
MNMAVVCVCSSKPDSLANVITYLVAAEGSLNLELILLSDNYATAPGIAYIDTVAEFLDQLSVGKYNGKLIEVAPRAAHCYEQAAAVLREARGRVKRVYFRDLSPILRKVAKLNEADQVTIDVTCLPKPLASDVTITCTFLGLRVYSFELTKPPERNHPEGSMYHALSTEGFRHACLTDPAIIEEGMREFTPKRALRISVLAVCIVSIACFGLLMWLRPRSSTVFDLTLWIGLVASALGIGTGLLQLAATKDLTLARSRGRSHALPTISPKRFRHCVAGWRTSLRALLTALVLFCDQRAGTRVLAQAPLDLGRCNVKGW